MHLLTLIVGIVILGGLLGLALWVGLYVVLPVFLFLTLVSAALSLVRNFLPAHCKRHVAHHQKAEKIQVIDVEFEEIK